MLEDHLNPVHLKTLSGEPICRLGLASQYLKDVTCVQMAVESGINYFFSYDSSSNLLLDALKPSLGNRRERIFIATGNESR